MGLIHVYSLPLASTHFTCMAPCPVSTSCAACVGVIAKVQAVAISVASTAAFAFILIIGFLVLSPGVPAPSNFRCDRYPAL